MFTALTQEMIDAYTVSTATTFSYITISEGNYYLAEPITTDKVIYLSGTVNLCFNGYTITSTFSGTTNNIGTLMPGAGAVFSACDCQGGGGFTASSGTERYVINTCNSNSSPSTVSLYGGTFTGSIVAYIPNCTLTVDGATLTATSMAINTQTTGTVTIKSGIVTSSGSYGVLAYTDVTVEGGTIKANRYALDLNVSGSSVGTVSLSGSPVLQGGSADIFLYGKSNRVNVSKGPTGRYTVSLNNPAILTEAAPVTITTADDKDNSSHFTPASTMTGVKVRNSGEGENQVVQLYRPHRHDGVEYTALTSADVTDGGITLTSGSYFLAENVPADITIPEGEAVDLCLNGKTLSGQIAVNGTLNLYDCKNTGTVSYTSGSALVGNSGSVVNYYGGTLVSTSNAYTPLRTQGGVVNLYATPTITSGCGVDIQGSSEGFLHICAALTKPTTPLRVNCGSPALALNGLKQVTLTTGWTESMGSTADPADYFAPGDNYHAKVELGGNGEAVLRLFQVTVDGKICYPSYENGTLRADDLPAEPAARPGYIWEGWYDAETGGNQVKLTADTPITRDLTLYPRWTICDHSGNQDEGTQTNATCTEPGVARFTCSVCHLDVETVTSALGHEFETSWTGISGVHYHACSRHGCDARADETPHREEPYTSGNLTSTPATCTTQGTVPYWCPDCGTTWNVNIPALGHDFSVWAHDASSHWRVCAREGCGEAEDKTEHTFGDWAVTTPAQVGAEGEETRSCTACGYSEAQAVDALPAPTYAVTYELDAYTVGTAPTQADAAQGDTITLPGSGSGLTRTGYTLAGWALLDETDLPGEDILKSTFTMPGRDVTFQVCWDRVDNYQLQPGEALVLEDGTVIENHPDGTVTIDQDGDGSPETTITLPDGADSVTVRQGDDGEKDKIRIPKGTEVQTGDGPVITLGGDGTVDVTGAVDAPEGSTAEDGSGNTVTITDGDGRIDPDGVITFPEGEDGKITVEDKDGNTSEVTVPGGREGAEVTPGGSVLVDDSDSTVVITTPEGPITITLPEGGADDETALNVDEDTGAITVPPGSTVEDANGNTITVGDEDTGTVNSDGTVDVPGGTVIEDEDGNKITIGEGGGSVDPDGAVTVPPGTVIEDENGNTTTITEGTGTVNPNGTVTFPEGGKLTVTDSEGQETEVTVNPGGTVDPENPNPPSGGGASIPVYRPDVAQPAEGGSVPAVSPSAPRQGDKVTITPKPDPGYGVENVTVTDRNGNSVEVTANPDGTYSFTQPGGKVTISVTYRETGSACDGGVYCPSRAFADLSNTAWYHEAVDYVLANGIMGGYGDGVFGPNNALSRAMLCQILYNREGRPAVTAGSPFTDVADTAWYAGAVTWANLNGIVSGYGGGLFGPDAPITREQLAAILYRYAQFKGYDTAADGAAIRAFSDYESVSAYAVDAMTWAVDTGVVGGYEDRTLRPRDGATRAQAAQMLMNFLRAAG